MEPLLLAQDVAKLLNIRPATVYALVERGVLPHVRIAQGKRRSLLRFRVEDITRFIQERSMATTEDR